MRSAAARAFAEIPRPKGWPVVGTALELLATSTSRLHRHVDRRHRELGSVFREKVGPVDCVFLSEPSDMRAAFAVEGRYPVHILPEPWVLYNEIHGCSRGLFFMDGEEWLHFRRIMNKLLLKGDLTWIDASCELVSKMLVKSIKTDVVSNDLEGELYKLSLDMIVAVLLGPETYLNARPDVEDRVKYLSSTIHDVFNTSEKLNLIPAKLAFKLRVPRWKRFEKSVANALRSGNDLVEYLSEYYPNGDGLLRKMQKEISFEDSCRIVTDLVLAAGDTTAYSMEWMLYLMAKNKKVQDKLRNYIKSQDHAARNSYLRNIVRESLRLYPVAPFLTRIMTSDVTIGGYEIPKGTVVIMSIFTSGRDPRYFTDPEEFLPERWSKTVDGDAKATHLASLPFAMGSRSCIGKKVAESLLQSAVANVVENFEIELCNKRDVDVIMKMVIVPSEPIRLKFKKI